MGEIVNLRQVRKQRARAEAARLAAEKRALHGSTKAERRRTEAEAARHDAALDGARVEKIDPPGD